MSTEPIVYYLNRHSVIESVSGPWDEFATNNGGCRLGIQEVCGNLIWDYVHGSVTRMWLEAIFDIARMSGQAQERLYRCDSPTTLRFMRMKVSPVPKDILRIEHCLLKAETRSPAVHIHLQKALDGSMARRCSICGRIKRMGGWVEPTTSHYNSPNGIKVTYTVCEQCSLQMPGTR